MLRTCLIRPSMEGSTESSPIACSTLIGNPGSAGSNAAVLSRDMGFALASTTIDELDGPLTVLEVAALAGAPLFVGELVKPSLAASAN